MEMKMKKAAFELAGDSVLGKALAKTALYGVFSNTNAGIDVHYRTGMGDVVPTDVKSALGPSLSTVVNVLQTAFSNPANAETAKLIVQNVSPGLGNYLMAATGDARSAKERERLNIVYTPYERMIRAMGFKPIRETLEGDKSYIINTEERLYKEKTKRLIDAYLSDKVPFSELQAAGITKKQVETEKEKKNMTRFERMVDQVPDKRQKEYEALKKF